MLTPRHLQQILTIAELGTFNQAAQRLNLSQPALTASINTLEERLGVRLFLRSKKGAEPTVFGHHILKTAPDILSRLNRLEDELGLLAGGERGSLRVAAGPVVIHGVLRQVVPAFCRAYPDFQLTLQTSSADQITKDVAAGRLDLGIGALNAEACGPDVMLQPLFEEPMQIASRPAHPLQGAQALSLKDIAAYPLSLPEIPSDLQAQIAAMGGASAEPLRTTLTTDQYDMIMDVVQNGNMLTCAPRHLLRPYVEGGRLRVLSQSALQPVWRASAAYRPVSALSPAFSALLEMIQGWFAQQS
ncbi:LysR family transcriptional regulator [Shimia sp.]|uniref:LysR family transcriptional regulator n=1 Tax=Shimia sp. TaxID=1954381 RepID=UPI003BAC7DF9